MAELKQYAGRVNLFDHAERGELADQGDDYLLATARAQGFSHGYFDQTAQLWSRSGELLAIGHQFVYFKG